MDAQADLNYRTYKSTLSPKQRKVLDTVESGTVPQVNQLLDELSKKELQCKWLDYVLVTSALKRGHKSLIKFLLKYGCRTKNAEKTKFHCTPLHYAFERSDPHLASDLMRSGASINATDVNAKSFLEFALHHKQPEMIDLILQNLKSIDHYESLDPNTKNNIDLFHLACFKNNSQAIRVFLECNFSVNSRSNFDTEQWKGYTCLHFTLSGGYSRSIKSSIDQLLKKKVDFTAQDAKGNTPIHLAFKNKSPKYACYLRDSSIPKKWLKDFMQKEFCNIEDQNGLSYFHIICCGLDDLEASKYMKAVKLFLDNGVEINKSVSLEDEHYPGYTALHFAVRNLHLDITKLLLDNGADVTKTSKEGMTPLHLASDSSTKPNVRVNHYGDKFDERLARLKIAELLLEYGADVNAKDLQARTPVHHAFYSKGKDESLTRLLLSKSQLKSNHTDSWGLSYLHIASSLDLSIVETLVELGAPINSCVKSDAPLVPGYSVLHFAVSFNKADIVEYLLDNGANPSIRIDNDVKSTALQVACNYTFTQLHNCEDWKINVDIPKDLQNLHSDKIRIAELLLQHGASINEKDALGNTPLTNAVFIFRRSILYSQKIGSYDFRVEVLERIEAAQRELIEFLLRNGADVHERNNKGESILHAICNQAKGSQTISVVEMMLERGADVNSADVTGRTPLHVAIQNLPNQTSDLPLIQLLQKYGADVNAMSPELGTPLHLVIGKSAYMRKENVIFNYLMGHPDIDLDAQKASKETPLHMAAKNCFHDEVHSCLEKLLKAGADINIESSDGLPPLQGLCEWLADHLRDLPDGLEENFIDYSIPPRKYFVKVSEIVITHFKKLTKANVFVSEKVAKSFDALIELCPEESEAIDVAIEEESNRLRSKMINKHLSLYQISLKHANDMVNFVKNKELKEIVAAPALRSDYPIFCDMLSTQFRRGSLREPIWAEAKKALALVFCINLPEYCVEQILKYLCNADLKILIKSVSVEDSCKNHRQDLKPQDESQAKRPRLG